MNKKLLLLLALLITLPMALLPALADDDDDDDADGITCYTPHLDELAFYQLGDYAGEKLFASTVETAVWTGIFTGTSRDYGFVTFDDPSGPTQVIANMWFDTVEVAGKSGGLEMNFIGNRPTGTGEWTGTWVITSSSGDLESLEGNGEWWGPGWQGNPEECGVIYYAVDDLEGVDFDDDDDDD